MNTSINSNLPLNNKQNLEVRKNDKNIDNNESAIIKGDTSSIANKNNSFVTDINSSSNKSSNITTKLADFNEATSTMTNLNTNIQGNESNSIISQTNKIDNHNAVGLLNN